MKEVNDMRVGVRENEIVAAVHASERNWVSVEAQVDYELDPTMLFQLTEAYAGDRFYFKKNDNSASYFGYGTIKQLKNDLQNKQSIFQEWEQYKNDIELIHPNSTYHHLRICGGFQFSAHKESDEWNEFGLNHFTLPEVLVTMSNGISYITYTGKQQNFDIDYFKSIVEYLTQPTKQVDLDMGHVETIEDIYKDEWRELVKETIAKLNDDSKVVLARKRLVEFDKPINIAYILKQAMQGEKNSYLVVLESANSIFFSQTPEQLMEVEEGVLYTKAIAGTISRSHDESVDQRNIDAFLNDNKNLNEHQFVVKSILHDINPYVKTIQYNDSPKILANDHLFHLLTEIKGDLKSESYIGLLDNLHPTPALGGFPKEAAVKYIDDNEFGTRGLYGAPVGYIDMYDNCEFVVAIRSMLIKEQCATLYAGCGIVNNSNPDSEVEETAIKFTPMMKALGVDKDDES